MVVWRIMHGAMPAAPYTSACFPCEETFWLVKQRRAADLHTHRTRTCMFLPLQNARNVLVASAPGASLGMAAKVADLGLSKVIKHNSHHTTNTVGTMNHTAPGEPTTRTQNVL
jgi:hypothetical protein